MQTAHHDEDGRALRADLERLGRHFAVLSDKLLKKPNISAETENILSKSCNRSLSSMTEICKLPCTTTYPAGSSGSGTACHQKLMDEIIAKRD